MEGTKEDKAMIWFGKALFICIVTVAAFEINLDPTFIEFMKGKLKLPKVDRTMCTMPSMGYIKLDGK